MGIPFKAIGDIAKAIGKMAEKAGKIGAREVPKRSPNIGSKIGKSKSGTAVEHQPSIHKPPIEEQIGRAEHTRFKTHLQKTTPSIRIVQIAVDGTRMIRGSSFDIKIPTNISLTPEKSELILGLSRELKTGSRTELLSQGFAISGNTITKQTSIGLLEGKWGIKLIPESPGHPTMKPRTIIEFTNF